MPNWCYFEMKIKGRKEDCEEWLNRMESYNAKDHFYRMFDVVPYDKSGTDEDFSMSIYGNCAWSLESCCRASGYSNGIDLFERNTRDLSIVMEAYSSEPDMCFQEHYIYNRGKCITNECEDYMEYWWDRSYYKTFEEFQREINIPQDITEEDFADEDCYSVGGFKNWDFII